ncbi:hypothetical protein [Bacillus sp. V59.32b]|uniref:hypothetical protein n=1 Tax=Bacillus sp. V59.32b TaxID=1758642 RepID=UPI000E3C4E26|nr:hypothetical protein [Bacillus sp. V59.32b]RFU62700.1 hypothetical protein D0463_13040 [Bacillus sp. V59.32b]
MKVMKNVMIILVLAFLLTSCSKPFGGCPDTEIEWVDLVKINDITYEHQYPDEGDIPLPSFQKGNSLGEIKNKKSLALSN